VIDLVQEVARKVRIEYPKSECSAGVTNWSWALRTAGKTAADIAHFRAGRALEDRTCGSAPAPDRRALPLDPGIAQHLHSGRGSSMPASVMESFLQSASVWVFTFPRPRISLAIFSV
jgi:hypothetical protein